MSLAALVSGVSEALARRESVLLAVTPGIERWGPGQRRQKLVGPPSTPSSEATSVTAPPAPVPLGPSALASLPALLYLSEKGASYGCCSELG